MRAIAPSPPTSAGYSAGARPLRPWPTTAWTTWSADVLAMADTMDMDTFDLVGHDWGGMVSWVAAARHPDRIRSLSVVSTPHPLALRARPRSAGIRPRRAGRRTWTSFRRPEMPERLLLGRGPVGFGPASALSRPAAWRRRTPGSTWPC